MNSRIPKICTVVFSYYPADVRVRREAEALVEAGMSVDVICLRNHAEPSQEIVDSVLVYRLPMQRKRAGKLRYIWEYIYFIFLAFFKLSLLHMWKRYNLIHVHNMPDILVFSALIPRLLGVKVIIDLHDPMPEAYIAKYSTKESHVAIRALRFMEKCSIRFAHLVLTPTVACRNLFIDRGCPPQKIEVIMNLPQERFFLRDNTENSKMGRANRERFTIMYNGTITERYGLNKAIEAISRVRDKIPNLLLHVYGEGDFVNQFLDRVIELDLEDVVYYHGLVSPETIAVAIQSIDIGLIPNEHSRHWDLAVPTRIFEFLSLKKPVIVPRTKGILDYFDDQSLHFFESGNVQSMAAAILDAYINPAKGRVVLEHGIKINQRYRWELQKQRLVELVTNLIGINVSILAKHRVLEKN
jgi:glycosyltransferase involved in cell wall biosynthesis